MIGPQITDLHHFSARFRQAKVVAECCGDTVSFAFLSQPFSGALFRQAGSVLKDSKLLNTISFKYNIFLGGCKKLFYVHLHLGNWGTFWFFNWVETTIPFGWCFRTLSRWLVGQTVSTRWICQENWQGLFPTAKGWRATTRWWSGTYFFSLMPFFSFYPKEQLARLGSCICCLESLMVGMTEEGNPKLVEGMLYKYSWRGHIFHRIAWNHICKHVNVYSKYDI